MRTNALCGASALLALALGACGGSATSPQKVVNDATAAVYNDDLNAMQSNFDAALQKQVTIDGVATLSQKLHAFGAYKGVTPIAADARRRLDATTTRPPSTARR